MEEREQSDQEIHREEFVHLVDLSHDRVLIAWGAFWFRRDEADGRWNILDDSELLRAVGRRTCIGHGAEPFGDAHLEVLDAGGEVVAEAHTADRCWVWVRGLEPDTAYRYRIRIDGRAWASGQRWDWVPTASGGYDLGPGGSYDLAFSTFPAPDSQTPPVRFVAMGDYGVGIKSDSESSRRQRRIADVLDELVRNHEVRFVLSLGDNIYEGEQGQVDDESGGEDDDWYSSFFQPYRYVVSRIPVFPAIGNHDTTDTEGSDDRAQMEDNFHVRERFRDQQDRASVGPGLFYRIGYGRDLELICIDTSQDSDDPDLPPVLPGARPPTVAQGRARRGRPRLADPLLPPPGVLRRTIARERPGNARDPAAALRTRRGTARAGRPRAQLPGLGGGRPHVRGLRGRGQAPRREPLRGSTTPTPPRGPPRRTCCLSRSTEIKRGSARFRGCCPTGPCT